MVENVGHDEGAQRAIREWKMMRVGDNLNAFAGKDFGGDEFGNKLRAITAAGTKLEDFSIARRNTAGEQSVPLVINGFQEWFGKNDLPAKFGGRRVVQIERSCERMGKQPAKKRGGQWRSSSQTKPGVPADAQHANAIGKNTIHFRYAVNALLIMHGHFHNFEMEFAGAEQQFVIAPKILDAPGTQVRFQAQPILAPQDLGSAKSVLDALIEKIGKEQAEEFVTDDVGELHCQIWHGIHEAAAIDETAVAEDKRSEEHRQLLRHHGEVGVEDHQDVTARGAKTGPDVFRFADAGAFQEADVFFRKKR